jgi:hypothetical protein
MEAGDEKIGHIVGEVDTTRVTFVSDKEKFPPRHEYLVIPGLREKICGKFKEIDALAQVTRLVNYSELMNKGLSLRELEVLISRYPTEPKVFGEAKIIGYLDEKGDVKLPRCAALPGQDLFIAPSGMLEAFFSKDPGNSIQVGTLITRDDVPVRINPNGFRKHLAIIAQTGAGKSYLVGLVLERLLPMGATILVFDPNSDYVMLRKDYEGKPTEISDDVAVYRPPGVSGRRFTDDEIGGAKPYTIEFSALSLDEVRILCGISTQWTHVTEALETAFNSLDGVFKPDALYNRLETMAGDDTLTQDERNSARKALAYVKRIVDYGVWGSMDIPLDELISPVKMNVIDLAGLQKDIMQYIVDKSLREIWGKAISGKLEHPVFIVMEEAHNYAPKDGRSRASAIVKRIASEGRKFGVFLILVTQRPGKVDDDVLSQCNSQIIMRITNPVDMAAVMNSSEALSEDLFNDLPGLNQGEAIVVGELTKAPVMVRISGRRGAEGGSDIDIIEALKKGKKAKEVKTEAEPTRIEDIRKGESRSEW